MQGWLDRDQSLRHVLRLEPSHPLSNPFSDDYFDIEIRYGDLLNSTDLRSYGIERADNDS